MKSLVGLLAVVLLCGCANQSSPPKAARVIKAGAGSEGAENTGPNTGAQTGSNGLPIGKDKQGAQQLREIGIAYQTCNALMGHGPTGVEELAPYLENNRRLLAPLKSGELVLIYNVALANVASPGNTVLGYGKEVPAKGGWVLLANGTIARMTAEEFMKAPQAKPRGK